MAETGDYYTADEITRRMSISTLVFQGYRPFSEQALQQLAENGITRIELVESRDQYDTLSGYKVGYHYSVGRFFRC